MKSITSAGSVFNGRKKASSPTAVSAAERVQGIYRDRCVSSPHVSKGSGHLDEPSLTVWLLHCMIRKITEYPEEDLGKVGQPVEKFYAALADLCADMYETMYDAEGVGLAPPQIGLK